MHARTPGSPQSLQPFQHAGMLAIVHNPNPARSAAVIPFAVPVSPQHACMLARPAAVIPATRLHARNRTPSPSRTPGGSPPVAVPVSRNTSPRNTSPRQAPAQRAHPRPETLCVRVCVCVRACVERRCPAQSGTVRHSTPAKHAHSAPEILRGKNSRRAWEIESILLARTRRSLFLPPGRPFNTLHAVLLIHYTLSLSR